ncbi:hypothetical protein KJ068_15065 [bacterium]|nr:hypothetical protein [bacterium]
MRKFSRQTIIETCSALEHLSHAELERFLLKFALENSAPQSLGSKTSRINSLIKYLLDNPDLKGPKGTDIVLEIIEEVISKRISEDFGYIYRNERTIDEVLPGLLNSLRHDGYVVKDGKIRSALPEIIDLLSSENELFLLLDRFGLKATKGHLEQAINAHTRGEWAAANAQLRSCVESLFDSIATILSETIYTPAPKSGHSSREFLATIAPPFLLVDLNEWEIGGKGGFLQGFWRRLHPQGSHPGLSDENDSTFRLHLVILISAHLLNRLNARMTSIGHI